MEFTEKTDKFFSELLKIDSLVVRNNTLPNQVFKDKITKFLVVEFNEILEEEFFQKINSFVRKINDSKWMFAVLNPEPENYFQYFNKYPFFEIDCSDSYADYFSITRNEPKPNSDDAIIYNMDVAILYSDSLSWAAYADRDFELGIFGFCDDETKQDFITEYGEARTFTIDEAIHNLLEIIYVNNIVPENIQIQLLKNYS